MLLKPSEVAAELGVSRTWLYDAAKAGRIPSIRIGGEDGPVRFVPEDVDRWIDEARKARGAGRGDTRAGRGGLGWGASAREVAEGWSGGGERSRGATLRGPQCRNCAVALGYAASSVRRSISSSVTVAPAARTLRSRWP